MKHSWLKGLEEEREKDVRANFKEALVLRKRMKEILEEKIEENRRVSRSKSSFDTPNWPYLQADALAYERALFDIIDLIS